MELLTREKYAHDLHLRTTLSSTSSGSEGHAAFTNLETLQEMIDGYRSRPEYRPSLFFSIFFRYNNLIVPRFIFLSVPFEAPGKIEKGRAVVPRARPVSAVPSHLRDCFLGLQDVLYLSIFYDLFRPLDGSPPPPPLLLLETLSWWCSPFNGHILRAQRTLSSRDLSLAVDRFEAKLLI